MIRPSFLTRLFRPVLDQITQGASPESLALAVSLGLVIGLFPIFGATTMLCLAVGVPLRLNQPALQTANHVMAVPQVLLIPLFVRCGEALFRLDPVPLDPRRLPAAFMAGPALFLKVYGLAGLGAAAVWALAAPAAAAILYYALRRGFRKMEGFLGRTAGKNVGLPEGS